MLKLRVTAAQRQENEGTVSGIRSLVQKANAISRGVGKVPI